MARTAECLDWAGDVRAMIPVSVIAGHGAWSPSLADRRGIIETSEMLMDGLVVQVGGGYPKPMATEPQILNPEAFLRWKRMRKRLRKRPLSRVRLEPWNDKQIAASATHQELDDEFKRHMERD